MSKDDSYSRIMGPYVKYWESILEMILKLIPWQNSILLDGFWPSSNWGVNYGCASIPFVVDVDLEDPIIPPYCGLRNMCPFFSIVAYMPFHTYLLVVLFLCGLQTLQSILFGCEGPKVML